MRYIDTLFNRMDDWRHLPNYQLERRADLFFSLYLTEVLEAKLEFPLLDLIVPEFPVRSGTIYPDSPSDRSDKVDYVALSEDGQKAILVELKTDGLSRRDKQDRYLRAAQRAGFRDLLTGVLHIFRATKSKRKYFALLGLLEAMGLLHIPSKVATIMSRDRLQGITEASRDIDVTTSVTESLVVYVQPVQNGHETISFEDFQAVVEEHDDPLSQRFARSLSEWAHVKAGEQEARSL